MFKINDDFIKELMYLNYTPQNITIENNKKFNFIVNHNIINSHITKWKIKLNLVSQTCVIYYWVELVDLHYFSSGEEKNKKIIKLDENTMKAIVKILHKKALKKAKKQMLSEYLTKQIKSL